MLPEFLSIEAPVTIPSILNTSLAAVIYNGKRTGFAAVNIALDMVKERLIKKEEAILRIPADDLSHLLAPIFDTKAEKAAKKIGSGLPAGPGAASGKIYFSWEDSVKAAEKGESVILVRQATSPEDLRGMIAADGILTTEGGASFSIAQKSNIDATRNIVEISVDILSPMGS